MGGLGWLALGLGLGYRWGPIVGVGGIGDAGVDVEVGGQLGDRGCRDRGCGRAGRERRRRGRELVPLEEWPLGKGRPGVFRGWRVGGRRVFGLGCCRLFDRVVGGRLLAAGVTVGGSARRPQRVHVCLVSLAGSLTGLGGSGRLWRSKCWRMQGPGELTVPHLTQTHLESMEVGPCLRGRREQAGMETGEQNTTSI